MHECVSLTISYHLHFLRISKVSSILHYGSVEGVQYKQCNSLFTYTFMTFFSCLSLKDCALIIFISFFDEVLNLHNRILTNHRPELVIRNCHWNCIALILLLFQEIKRTCFRPDFLFCGIFNAFKITEYVI